MRESGVLDILQGAVDFEGLSNRSATLGPEIGLGQAEIGGVNMARNDRNGAAPAVLRGGNLT